MHRSADDLCDAKLRKAERQRGTFVRASKKGPMGVAAASSSNSAAASDALMQVQVMAEVTATALTEVTATALTEMQAIVSATRTALEASWVALAAWTNVLHLTVQPLVRLAVIAWPSVRDSAIAGARLAAAQPRTVIAIEAAVIVAVLLLWRVIVFVRRRRYIYRARSAVTLRCERLEAYIRHRSRLLASALPHLSFILVCACCARLMSWIGLHAQVLAFLAYWETSLATGLPMFRTLWLLKASPAVQRPCLQYWVVWASVELCKGLLHAVPFVPRLGRAALPLLERWWPLTILYEIPFCAYLWLQMPGRRGLHLAYEIVAWHVQRRAARMGEWVPSVPEPAKGGLQMVLAAFIGIKLSADLFAAVHEGRVLLVGIFFLLMPTQIAAFGLPLLALGGPMLRSIEVIASAPANSGESAAVSARPNGDMEPSSQAAATQQLHYWLYYALMWFAVRQLEPVLVWIPFMTHLQLLFVLWLQCNILQWAVRALTLVLAVVRGSRRRGDRASVEGDDADKGKRHRSLRLLPCSPRLTASALSLTFTCVICVRPAGDAAGAVRQPRPNALYGSQLSRRGTSSGSGSGGNGSRSDDNAAGATDADGGSSRSAAPVITAGRVKAE